MSRKCSRSKENGFLAIPYSWNKLLGHNTSVLHTVYNIFVAVQQRAYSLSPLVGTGPSFNVTDYHS
jgi:hypothetical protein